MFVRTLARPIIAGIILFVTVFHTTRAASTVTFIPGTRDIEPALRDSLVDALQNASALTNGAQFFAVTDVQPGMDWAFVSVAGFIQRPAANWFIDDAAWLGLALAVRDTSGAWSSAVKDTPEFAPLMDRIPAVELSSESRAGLLPNQRSFGPLAPEATTYIFPWQSGTSMYYGSFGVHAGDYAWLGAYKAVDWLSDGNTSLGHAPNMLRSSTSGTINYKCSGTPWNSAVRIGLDMMYVHIISTTQLAVGQTFKQGDPLDRLQTGSFQDNCGWASQNAGWFHVHWMFPDTTSTTGIFQANGWTLTLSDSTWRRGAQMVVPQQWMLRDTRWLLYLPKVSIRI